MYQNIKYPIESLLTKKNGEVTIDILFSKDGAISTQILETTDEIFSKSLIEAAKGMPIFSPAKKRGKAIDYHQMFSYSFNAED